MVLVGRLFFSGKNSDKASIAPLACLIGNQFKNGTKKAPRSSKKSSKNSQNSNGSSSFLYLIDGGSML